jgi:hypothetical protein
MHMANNIIVRLRFLGSLRPEHGVGRQLAQAFALWTVIILVAAPLVAQTPTGAVINREYAIKAAFLYQFLNYVEWPPNTFREETAPFIIGVNGTNPFGTVLDQVAKDKKVAGRPIQILIVSSTSDVTKCHILFVPKSVLRPFQDSVLQAAHGSHVLTVGESEDFIDRGGAAQFVLEGNKVRFVFNKEVIAKNNLKVSSKLWALAKVVSDK